MLRDVRTFALIGSLLAACALPAPASARTVLLGRSWQGRPIQAIEVGDPSGTRVLVVGSIHGNETGGIAIARALEQLSPRGLDLWIVPDLNPDGVAAGTRQNSHGVDLNRNFPFRWRPMGGVYESGPRPLSEREARIAHTLILRLHPHLTIWFHQPLGLVDGSKRSLALERRFARLSGLPLKQLKGRYPGAATHWERHIIPGATAFVVELPGGTPSAARVDRYARAVLTVSTY